MGIEVVLLWIGLSIAGAYGVNKATDVYRHNVTIEADKYNSCVKHAQEVRECRNLE